jgi:hypothetical protein
LCALRCFTGIVGIETLFCTGKNTDLKRTLDDDTSELVYTPSSCFIQAKDIPKCLLCKHGNIGNTVYAACVITMMQHSICVYNHGANKYSYFDSMVSVWFQHMTCQEITSRLESLCRDVVQADATVIYISS